MASRVEYSISMTPIVTIDAVSNQSPAVDVIESDIGRMVGGTRSINSFTVILLSPN